MPRLLPLLFSSPFQTGTRAWLVVLASVSASAISAVIGFYVCALHVEWTTQGAARDVPPFDHFLREASFSGIDNARDELQGEASRFVVSLGIPRARAPVTPRGPARTVGTGSGSASAMDTVVLQLRDGIERFRGTEQEIFLVQHLLWTLRSQSALDAWLDAYLDAAYRHPTDPFVARNAGEAWNHARTTHRVDEVLRAFRHLQAIPFEHPARSAIDYVLGSTGAPIPD